MVLPGPAYGAHRFGFVPAADDRLGDKVEAALSVKTELCAVGPQDRPFCLVALSLCFPAAALAATCSRAGPRGIAGGQPFLPTRVVLLCGSACCLRRGWFKVEAGRSGDPLIWR